MIALLVVIGLLAVLAFALYVVATRRVAKAVGQPTPAEAKIEAQTLTETAAIKENGEKLKAEVLHADRDGLLARLRDRVRGK